MTSNFTLPRPLRRSGSLPSSRTVRIVVLGQGAVGKTAMTVRFITKRFIGEYDPTLETIYRHEASINGDVVHFEILDTAGQEEDTLLLEEKIKWGDGFLIVYSVTDRCSFDEVMRLCFLVNHINSGSRKAVSEPLPILIVANKKDLEFDRMVTTEDGEKLSGGLKLPFFEISARDSCEETAAVFHTLYGEIMKQLSSSPTSFRRRAVSKLMDKIPRIHSNSTLGSTGRSFSLSSFRDLLPD
nr:PREDICTED: ras-related and estrogen-regulated growth inhibitor-like isoform X1 [Lepisosteus oculatus]